MGAASCASTPRTREREIGDVARGLVGHVRVGIVPTAAQFLLPPAARQLLLEAPDVTLRTVVALVDVLSRCCAPASST